MFVVVVVVVICCYIILLFIFIYLLLQFNVSKILSDLLSIVSTHKVSLEPNFTCVVLALMVLEGLGRSLDPNLDLLDGAKMFLFRAAL